MCVVLKQQSHFCTNVFPGNQYWQYDDSSDPAVSTIYPQPISEWSRLLAGGIDAAIQWKNKRTYFFKGDEYYRYNDTSSEVSDFVISAIKNYRNSTH